jgi:hypothetical protein
LAFAADNMQMGSTPTLRQYGVDTDENYPYRGQVTRCFTIDYFSNMNKNK